MLISLKCNRAEYVFYWQPRFKVILRSLAKVEMNSFWYNSLRMDTPTEEHHSLCSNYKMF